MTHALLIVAAAVVIHEAGHAFAAQALGLRWKVFVRFPVSLGVAAEPHRIVAVYGPAASLVAAYVGFRCGWPLFTVANLFFGVVSLVPLPLFDGWRVLGR